MVRTLARAERVSLVPEAIFDHLERPEYFFDGLHLNREGRRIFSRILADQVAELLAE